MTLLIVDDNAVNLKLLRAILEAEGHDVITATDGVEALAELECAKVDVIISDILMPRMDGYRLCYEVRTRESLRLLPFIIYTASYTSPADEVLALEFGADKYLRKPATAKVIVESLLELTSGERYRQPRGILEPRESGVMKEYNERLVAKLEEKNHELQLRTEELRATATQLLLQSTALATAANAITITDSTGTILWANPAFTGMTGYTAKEAIGQTPRLLKSDRHPPEFYHRLWQTILAGQTWRGELINRRKDGSLYHGEQTITPVCSSDGAITHFIAIMNDVTSRKEAEEKLRVTHTQLCQLLEHSPAVIYTLKIEGQQVAPAVVSENIERLLGVTVAEAGSYDWWLDSLHPDDRDRVLAGLAGGLKNGGYKIEYRIRHKDGTYRWVEDTNRVIRDASGHTSGAVGVWTEVTARKTLEAEVTLRERRIDSFFAGATAGLALIDKDLRFIQVNETLAEMNGVPAREHLGKTVYEVVPQIAPTFMPLAQKVLETGEPILNFELSGETPRQPGVLRHWMESLFPIPGKHGKPEGVGAIVVEITERKMAEASLRDSEERFRQLAENINEVFWITDPAKNTMIYISPAYETIWGRTCESLYQSPDTWLDAIHPADRGRVLHALARQASGTYDEAYRILRPDGSMHWIRDRAFPVRNAAGEIYRMVGTAVDITVQKQSEEQISEQAALLDAAHDAIYVKDFDDRIIYWNKGAERAYGWSFSEVQGRVASGLFQSDPVAMQAASAQLTTQGEWQGEMIKHTKDGRKLTVEVRWTLVRDAHGQPKSILAINTDITEKKKFEAQFLRAQRMESIGTLAGGIAHDLNNAIAPIMMGLEFLRLKYPMETKIVDMFEPSARRAAAMVRQLLTFAKGAEGQRVAIQTSHLVHEMENIMRGTFPKNIRIVVDWAPNLPTMLGDATQVHQIILNLCVNARDAMPHGGTLTLEVHCVEVDATYASTIPDAKPGRYVVLRVRDTGTGIPPEVLDRMFDPFFTTKGPDKGTGLGLFTVLGIVKGHRGFLQVYSQLGKGSTFAIHLPAIDTDDHKGGVVPDAPEFRGQGETILFVDDEAAVREAACAVLGRLNFKAVTATDGADGLLQLGQHRSEVRAIITDLHMPHVDGLHFVRAIRRILPDIPVIVASGKMEADLVEDFKTLGVTSRLDKPFTEVELAEALGKLLVPLRATDSSG